MISCFIIGMLDIFIIIERDGWKKIILKTFHLVSYYVPAIVLSVGFLLYHFIQRGWIGYDPLNSLWAGCYERVGLAGLIRNIFIVGWRLVDFGRLFLWIVAGYFLILIVQKKLAIDRNIKLLFFLFAFTLTANLPPMLIYKVLSSHRYIIPVYIVFATLVAYLLLEKMANKKLSKILYAFLIIGMLSGNFWVYPDTIAKGWDATLAHWPYYKLRKEMISYIDKQKIPFAKVGSDVPNLSRLKYVDLSNDERAFVVKDLRVNQYVFYSNIYNNFTDEEIKELKEKWLLIREFKMIQVRVTLYKNPSIKE